MRRGAMGRMTRLGAALVVTGGRRAVGGEAEAEDDDDKEGDWPR